ncbi:amino acid transporter [Ascodesmis nigricans]|uniref:Amino acid transporter n=1 Tax=Ascodesmis nigricans TaxID=341454 RepID=A0A4S2MT67_9PEZI|nr:amino acid transporter [Ascodesmis nigricans]
MATTFSEQQRLNLDPYGDLGLALDSEDAELLQEAVNEAAGDPDALLTDTPNAQKLKTFSVICLICNRMIGTGIFSTPSRVVEGIGSVPLAIVLWVVGVLVTFMGLSVFLELGLSVPRYLLRGRTDPVTVPRSGGEKNYLEYIYRRPKYLATCVFAFCYITLGNTGGNAVSFAQHFLSMCGVSPQEQSDGLIRGVAIAMLTFACLLHGAWRNGGIYLSNILAILKVGTVLVVIGTGFAGYGKATKGYNEHVSKDMKTFGESNSFASADALLAVVFSFGGFNNANYVLSEVHKPQRTLKIGSFAALSLISTLYVLAVIAYSGVLTSEEIIRSGSRCAQYFFEKAFGGDHHPSDESAPAARAMSGLIALSSFGNIIVVTFVAARVKQEIAKEGILPFSKFFAGNTLSLASRLRGKKRRNGEDGDEPALKESTPVAALFLHWCFSVIVAVAPDPSIAYTLFVSLYTYAIDVWLTFFIAAGLLWLRFRPKSTWAQESNYRPWGGPIQAIIYTLLNLFLIISPWIHVDAVSWKHPYPFWMYPTIVCGLLVAGALYWVGFVFVWPRIYRRELRVQRIPILLDDVQVNEIITYAWVVPESKEPEVIQVPLPPSKHPAGQSPAMPYSSPMMGGYAGSPYSAGAPFTPPPPPQRFPPGGEGRW